MAANSVNFFQAASEPAIDARQIQRQRDLADLLMRQGQTPQQGQMVSGHYVAPSKAAYVSQLVSALAGGLQSRRADEQERAMAQKLAAGRAQESGDFLSALNGAPGRSISPLTPNDDEGNPMPAAQSAAIAPDRNKALAIALQSQNPQLQGMGGELLKRQMDAAEFSQALQAARGGSTSDASPGASQAADAAVSRGASPASGGAGAFGLDPAAFALSASPNSRAQALGKMVQDANKPNWMNIGGNLVNTSSPGFAGGPQTQLNVSANGQATMSVPDGKGGWMVGAPNGALDTYQAYQEAENRSRAQNTPGRPMIRPDGRMGGQSQLSEITGGGAPPMPMPTLPPAQAGVTGNFQGDPQRIAASIAAIGDPQERANAQAALEQQMRGQGNGPAAANAPLASVAAGGGLEFSPEEKAAQEAAKARLVDTAKADVVRNTGQVGDMKKAGQMREAADSAMKLLNAGPTGSGMGALTDNVLNFVGQPTASGTAAQQLEAIGGALMANVPRMEGPQSDADVRNYKLMAGNVGDRTLPVEARKAALRTVIEIQDKYAALNGGAAPRAPAPAPAAGGLPAGWTVKVR